MSMSINTNDGAMHGIRSLRSTNTSLSKTQNELNSGFKVSSAKDNSAIFSIAQVMRGVLSGQNSVQSSLDNAISTSDVSLTAGSMVSDLLIQMKEKALSAADPGLDDSSRAAYSQEFSQMRDQITSVLESSGFNGRNPLVAGGGDITAITNETGDSTITIPESDLSLGGANVTVAADQALLTPADAQAALSAVNASIENVSTVLAEIGAGAQRLDDLKEFTTKLSDTVQQGVGNLVDADMGKVAANLAADKVKQSLGIQSINIANQSKLNILQLFK